jgi:hypothetical protein
LDFNALNLVWIVDQCLHDLFYQRPDFHLLLLPGVSTRTNAG